MIQHSSRRSWQILALVLPLIFIRVSQSFGAQTQDPSSSPEIVKLSSDLTDCVTDYYEVNRKVDARQHLDKRFYQSKSLKVAAESCRPKFQLLLRRYDAIFGPGMGLAFMKQSYLPDLNRAIMERLFDTPEKRQIVQAQQKNMTYISGAEVKNCKYTFLLAKNIQNQAEQNFKTIRLREDLIGKKFAVTEVNFDLTVEDKDVLDFDLKDLKQAEDCFPFLRRRMHELRTEYDAKSKALISKESQ